MPNQCHVCYVGVHDAISFRERRIGMASGRGRETFICHWAVFAHDGAGCGCGYFSIIYLKHPKICNSLP